MNLSELKTLVEETGAAIGNISQTAPGVFNAISWDASAIVALGATILWRQILSKPGWSHPRQQIAFSFPPTKVGKPQIYTYGYHGKHAADLFQLAAQLDAVVFDIRLMPRSRFAPEWNENALRRFFGSRYIHAPEWGNRNYKKDLGEGIMLKDYPAGLKRLAAVKHPVVILICVCKNHHKCHRTTVANLLRTDGYTVQEYGWQPSTKPQQADMFALLI